MVFFAACIGHVDDRQHRTRATAPHRPRLSVQPALDRHHRRHRRRDSAGRDRVGRASFSPDSVREFGGTLRPVVLAVGSVLLQVFIFITDLLLRLIEPLIPIIKAILQGLVDLLGRIAAVFRDFGLNINVAEVQRSIENFLNSPEFLTVTRGSLMLVVLVAFILVVVWALYRSGLLSRRNFDETRENIASRELLRGQIKQLLSRLRLRRTQPRQPVSAVGAALIHACHPPGLSGIFGMDARPSAPTRAASNPAGVCRKAGKLVPSPARAGGHLDRSVSAGALRYCTADPRRSGSCPRGARSSASHTCVTIAAI